jgi:hypothetical protein
MGTQRQLYRERGGLDNLILIDEPALTAGMVKVARLNENWQTHPELTWQVWPADLELMEPVIKSARKPLPKG